MPAGRIARRGLLGAAALALLVVAALQPRPSSQSSLAAAGLSGRLPPSSSRPAQRPDAVRLATEFLVLHSQPEGTYITAHGNPSDDDVVPMSLAHAAWALARAGQADRARASLAWMLARMHRDDPRYAGSWYNHYHRHGRPWRGTQRGRGEDTAMVLVAIYSYWREADPAYLSHLVAGRPVADYVQAAGQFLTRLQHPDGRFSHSPVDHTAYYEENARMAVATGLAAELLAAYGNHPAALEVGAAASRGRAALLGNGGDNPLMAKLMAYDYYWGGIWKLVQGEPLRAQLARARRADLLVPGVGVRSGPWDRFTRASETFDWAIAQHLAGNQLAARRLVDEWIAVQRPDGSFPDWRDPFTGGMGGHGASYAAARYLLYEQLAAGHPHLPN